MSVWRTVASRVLAVLALGRLGAFTVSMSVSFYRTVEIAFPFTAAFAAMAALSAASAVRPLRRSPRFIVDWSLSGAFRASSARLAAAAYARSVRKIRELSRVPVKATLRRRLATLLARADSEGAKR